MVFGPRPLPPVPEVQVGTIIKMMAMRPSEFVPKKPPGLNGGLPGTMIPSWNAVIRNLDGRLVKPATVRLRSVLQVQMFAQIAPALPQRLMPMWDVKVALVSRRVKEPQAALGMLVTQGVRIVQVVLVRRLVPILVTMSKSRRGDLLEHPHEKYHLALYFVNSNNSLLY